jgi:superfamily II DNA/RNA helicase
MQTEVQNLSQPPALLIGTPGRILEHITRESFALDGVKILVLDEFDKSLSMGFQEQMTDIIKALPALEKRVLVSATSKLNIPEFVGITHPRRLNYTRTAEKSTDGLRIKTVISTSGEKIDTLYRLLCLIGEESVLIFCNQRDSTERTKAQLDALGIRSACFHGGMEQLDRETTLIKFRNGSILFLVASDLAARGLDIPDVKHVIHFELPLKNNDFIHRNGRTARMYSDGIAYLILNPDEPLPAYLEIQPERFQLPEERIPPPFSPWMTLYISGGKKDKLSKIDIVGFLSKKGNLQQDDIGKIELMDFMSFVAVKKNVVGPMLDRIQKEKMKGKKYKIGVAK